MAVLKSGKYLGKYKEGENEYHMFSPEQIATEGTIKYTRIGDYHEEFPTNRNYTLINVNKEEEKLIKEKK